MKNGVAIYGRFEGTEDPLTFDLSDRDFMANETILIGDLNGDNGPGFSNNVENSYHVIVNNNNGLNSSAILDGFTITKGNAIDIGGGMYNSNSSPTVTNCSFAGNSSSAGGGIFNFSSSPVVTNCIIWGNNSSGIENNTSTPTVSYSIVQGGYDGTGNLNVDPLFVQQPPIGQGTTGNLRLQPCSPAINTGNNASVPSGITTDLDGNPRIYNSGTVDMGAYEYQSVLSDDTRWYVNAAAANAGNGSSWDCAFRELQMAINASDAGDEIWVAAGTYNPTQDPFGNSDPAEPRDRTFYLKEGISIYGGFAGTESDLSERNTGANPTILSGDFNGDDLVTGSGISLSIQNSSENAFHVIISVNDIQSITLDGFTISGGSANGQGDGITVEGEFIPSNVGGGMYTVHFTGLIYNCSFTANYSSAGSGMYNDNSSIGLINCTFSLNLAQSGGGMYNYDGNTTLINSTFTGNAGIYGGGSAWNYSGQFTVMNSILWGNYGGELQNNSVLDIIVNRTLIQGGFTGTGNLDVDPQFVNAADPAGPDGYFDTADDGISIRSSSPAINAGSPAVTTPVTDITGFVRTGVFDMGAYENQNPCANPTDGGTIASDQNICSGATPAEITSSSLPSQYTGDLEFQWQHSTVSAITGFSDISGANDTSYQPGTLSDTTWYRRLARVSCISDWTAAASSSAIKISIEPTPVSGTLAKNPDVATLCEGTDVSAALTAGSGGNGTDSLSYRTHNGTTWSSWSAYTSETNISTPDKTMVEIQTMRKSDYCSDASAVAISWIVDPTTVAGSIGGS